MAALAIMIGILVVMAVEGGVASANERAVVARGAIEPRGDVYRVMRVAYPGCFLLMGIEGVWRGAFEGRWMMAGALIFGASKALKYWAIATLGRRWTFRVLVLPDTPLVGGGPYRYLTHPNYVAVVGELIGGALLLHAPLSGTAALLGFGALLRRRITIEERALRISTRGT